MTTVKLITCNHSTEAHIIKGRLANEEIECVLTNQNFTNLMPVYNNMLGAGIQVIVHEEDLQKAKEIIKDLIGPSAEPPICSNCGSTDIGLGLGKRKGLKIFNIIIALFAALPFGNIKSKYYCKNCGTELG